MLKDGQKRTPLTDRKDRFKETGLQAGRIVLLSNTRVQGVSLKFFQEFNTKKPRRERVSDEAFTKGGRLMLNIIDTPDSFVNLNLIFKLRIRENHSVYQQLLHFYFQSV